MKQWLIKYTINDEEQETSITAEDLKSASDAALALVNSVNGLLVSVSLVVENSSALESAISKLKVLGLTADEALALVGSDSSN